MQDFNFNNWGTKSIELEFKCDSCGQMVESEEILVPYPNMSAENDSDSQIEEEGYAVCECGKEFEIEIFVSLGGGYGSINELPRDWEINVKENLEDYDEDWYGAVLSNTEFFETFKTEIYNLRQLNQEEIFILQERTFRRLIFVGAIATLETYLSDAFINTFNSSEKYKQKFVETYDDFKKEKFCLNEIYKKWNNLDNICREILLNKFLFHKLIETKKMYKNSLDVDFGDISQMIKYVFQRHDLVHRNGKTKEGADVNIDKKTIDKLLDDIYNFVKNIDNQIKKLNTI
ncbi:MAG: hypothetical protein FWC10_05565 [Lentimicrobiaceae bacterium]|nr:hypothetical protein [Lentimicrobiaceae bacterium]